jgi:PAS domain S-box-containing protein
MHVLSPSGNFIFASTSITELGGYTPEELFSRSVFDYIHPDDVSAFRRDFDISLRTGDTLTLYYRFKTKDERFVLFEVTGHPYYSGGGADEDGSQQPQQMAEPQKPEGRDAKAFFAMARPYPSKNQAMLDSFLELKFENERLRQELLLMYKEVEGDAPDGGTPLFLPLPSFLLPSSLFPPPQVSPTTKPDLSVPIPKTPTRPSSTLLPASFRPKPSSPRRATRTELSVSGLARMGRRGMVRLPSFPPFSPLPN